MKEQKQELHSKKERRNEGKDFLGLKWRTSLKNVHKDLREG